MEMSGTRTPCRYRKDYDEFVSIDVVFYNDYFADQMSSDSLIKKHLKILTTF